MNPLFKNPRNRSPPLTSKIRRRAQPNPALHSKNPSERRGGRRSLTGEKRARSVEVAGEGVVAAVVIIMMVSTAAARSPFAARSPLDVAAQLVLLARAAACLLAPLSRASLSHRRHRASRGRASSRKRSAGSQVATSSDSWREGKKFPGLFRCQAGFVTG